MTSPTIVSLVVSALLLVYVILSTIQALRKHTTINLIPFVLFALGTIFTIFLVYRGKDLAAGDLGLILLTLGLVVVTAIYAWETEKLANITRKQFVADSRPYLVIKLPEDITVPGANDDQLFELLSCGMLSSIRVTIKNIGKNTAINIEPGIWNRNAEYVHQKIAGYLVPDAEQELFISTDLSNIEKQNWIPDLKKRFKSDNTYVVALKYGDLSGSHWVTHMYLEFHAGYISGGVQDVFEVDV